MQQIKLILVSTLIALAGRPALSAQSTNPVPGTTRSPRRVPVTIVLVHNGLRPGASSEIRRRSWGDIRDVIVLPDSATAEALSDAVRGMLTARLADGDTATRAGTFRVRPNARTGESRRAAFPWAERVLSDLRHAPVRTIAGVGQVRAVQIWLPSQRHPQTTAGVHP